MMYTTYDPEVIADFRERVKRIMYTHSIGIQMKLKEVGPNYVINDDFELKKPLVSTFYPKTLQRSKWDIQYFMFVDLLLKHFVSFYLRPCGLFAYIFHSFETGIANASSSSNEEAHKHTV